MLPSNKDTAFAHFLPSLRVGHVRLTSSFSNRCLHVTRRFTSPLRSHQASSPSPSPSPSPSSSTETTDVNDVKQPGDFIFKPSPFNAHRQQSQSQSQSQPEPEPEPEQNNRNTKSTNAESAPSTSKSISFSSHEELMDEYENLSGDPLENEGGRIVAFRGDKNANLMIIGEAPGEQEDALGMPFVGKSGQLLDNIFRYGGFNLNTQIYVTNVVKRRPSDNRTPTVEEMNFYLPYLMNEIRLVNPGIIILAGSVPMRALLGQHIKTISKVRGKWFSRLVGENGEVDDINNYAFVECEPNENVDIDIDASSTTSTEHTASPLVMPIFHPSYLLRKPSMKREMVIDIHNIRQKYIDLYPKDKLNPLTSTK